MEFVCLDLQMEMGIEKKAPASTQPLREDQYNKLTRGFRVLIPCKCPAVDKPQLPSPSRITTTTSQPQSEDIAPLTSSLQPSLSRLLPAFPLQLGTAIPR